MLFKVTLTVSELLFVIQEELEGLSQSSTYVFPLVLFESGLDCENSALTDPPRLDGSGMW